MKNLLGLVCVAQLAIADDEKLERGVEDYSITIDTSEGYDSLTEEQ